MSWMNYNGYYREILLYMHPYTILNITAFMPFQDLDTLLHSLHESIHQIKMQLLLNFSRKLLNNHHPSKFAGVEVNIFVVVGIFICMCFVPPKLFWLLKEIKQALDLSEKLKILEKKTWTKTFVTVVKEFPKPLQRCPIAVNDRQVVRFPGYLDQIHSFIHSNSTAPFSDKWLWVANNHKTN